jgi:hypothetical protein
LMQPCETASAPSITSIKSADTCLFIATLTEGPPRFNPLQST